ncbi:choice-of-anchor J domain-containing protein [Pontibacter sp. FD36]|uniref:T9SS-dependent choice-of-anchor J family protein n=1 Tax=Pontibacter sp. FD36 TaxID=2789860 RepID=UPI0018AC4FE0|nr:choice-of-anchor J domain-containing protein [Pontibacter sp. FD36]MBF8964016.1 choice-of-anchor J domain-containing protein [Pontibacter sp. FD36]
MELYYSLDGAEWTSAGTNFKVNFPADLETDGYDVAPGETVSVTGQRLDIAIPAGGDIYFAWNYSVTSGTTTSFSQGLGVDNISIAFGQAAPQPVQVSTSSLAFGTVGINQVADILTYTLTGHELTNEVVVAVDGVFSVSKTEDGEYSQRLVYSPSQLEEPRTVYIKVATSAVGNFTSTITHSSNGVDYGTVALSAEVFSPYVQNFNNCATTLPGGWTAVNVTGDQVWGCTTFGRETTENPRNNGVQINGFSGSARENEDWLISPSLDLSDFNIVALTFWTRTAFKGPGLKLMVSTDYDGTSAPSTATWTELNGNFPELASDYWKQSFVDLSAYKGENVYVAFVYTAEAKADGAARWTVDDVAVENMNRALLASDFNYDFGMVATPNASEAQNFSFSAPGYEGMTLSVEEDFELSKDNETFASSITYSAEEAAASNKVYVRFKPASTKLRTTSAITFTSGDFSVKKGMLTGSSLPKTSTLDIVSWNVAWFGSTSGGPSNLDLQYSNTKKVLETLDADIIALQEISNDEKMEQLINELEGYSFVKSDVYSYSQKESSGSTLDPQKLYLVYKNETVQIKSQKVLLNTLYKEILDGRQLENYPGTSDSFWASGRLPYMVEVEATVNGVSQRINLVNLHTRANSGTDVSRYNMRKYDVQVLKDSLDAQYPNMNLVLLGDMNDDVDVSVVNNLPSSLETFVNDEDFKALTYDLSTTGAFTYAGGSYQSFLDHIIVSKSLTDEYIDESIAIENQFLNSISSFRTTTSDHVPVSARFTFSATPVLTFTEPSVTKTEDAGKFNVSLTLSEAQTTEHTVTVMIADETTASAADYTVTGVDNSKITVTIPANATTASFEVEIVDDNLVELSESVFFTIQAASTGLGLTSERSFELTIEDNDKSAVSFAETTLEVNEDAGTKTITLNLDQATVQGEEVTLTVTNGANVTYGAAGDYTTVPAVTSDGKIIVVFPEGATSATFTVTVNDDAAVEEVETVTFALSAFSAKMMEGENTSFTLSIRDNDMPTGLARRKNQEFRMYPNPTKGAVTIVLPEDVSSVEKATMTVISPEGIQVVKLDGSLDGVIAALNQRLPGLRNGMYFVQIQVRDKVYQSRLVKN